jgi:dihydrofolate reductase
MPRPRRIEGYAVVSADGMIADASGAWPRELVIEADQRFFTQALDAVDAVVHGRNSRESHPNSAHRRRIIVTRRVPALAPDPENDRAMLWNPAGASFAQAWDAFGIPDGIIAVIGGTGVFGLFLEIGYDAFALSRTERLRIPGGRPVLPGVPSRTPEAILAAHGLVPEAARVLDASAQLTLVTWRRPSPRPN